MLKFNVSQSRGVDQHTRFGFVEDTFHDDATAVLLKPAPLDSGLRTETTVFNGEAEGNGVARLHAQRHVLNVAGEVHGVGFGRGVQRLGHLCAVEFTSVYNHAVVERGARVGEGLSGTGLWPTPTFNDG